MDTPTPQPASPYFKPMTLGLAGLAMLVAPALTYILSRLPPEDQVWNLSAIGALSLFAAARLSFWQAVGITALAIGLKDLSVYLIRGWDPYPLSWLYFTGYVAIGWVFLRRSASPGRIVTTALGAGLLFFLVSNFVSWLEQAYPYGYSLEGLVNCYVAAIPFYRGTLVGDMVFSAALFGSHAILSRAYFPLERVQLEQVEERVW